MVHTCSPSILCTYYAIFGLSLLKLPVVHSDISMDTRYFDPDPGAHVHTSSRIDLHANGLLSESSQAKIATPSEVLQATHFPFVLNGTIIQFNHTEIDDNRNHHFNVHADFNDHDNHDDNNDIDDDDDDDIYSDEIISSVFVNESSPPKLSKMIITVHNGTLEHMETYPGLWIQKVIQDVSLSSSSVTIIGVEEDIESFIRDGKLAVNPLERNWVGSSSVRLTLMEDPKQFYFLNEEGGERESSDVRENDVDSASSASSAMIRMKFDPIIPFKMDVDIIPSDANTMDASTSAFSGSTTNIVEIEEDETLPFTGIFNIALFIEHEASVQSIDCRMKAKYGSIQNNVLHGSVTSIIDSFASNRYTPNINFNGMDVIEVKCEHPCGRNRLHLGQDQYPYQYQDLNLDHNERGGEGEGNLCSTSASFQVNVIPVNDEPQIVVPVSTFYMDEDERFKFGAAGLYIIDVDHDPTANTDGYADSYGNTDGYVPVNGQIDILNDLSIDEEYGDQSQGKGGEVVTITVDLQMKEGQILLPHPSELGGLRTSRISRSTGGSTPIENGTQIDDPNSFSQLQIVGQLDRVNIILQYLVIKFPTDWFGEDLLSIRCTDSLKFNADLEAVIGTDTATVHDHNIFRANNSISFVVNSINDAPIIHVNTRGLGITDVNQGDIVRFDQGSIQITDADGESDEIFSYKWQLTEVDGIVPGIFVLDDKGGKNSIGNTTLSEVQPAVSEKDIMVEDIIAGRQVLTFEGRCPFSKLSEITNLRLHLHDDFYGEIRGDSLTLRIEDSFGDSVQEEIPFSVLKVRRRPRFVASTRNVTTFEDKPVVLSNVANVTLSGRAPSMFRERHIDTFKVSIHSHMGGLIKLNKFVPGIFVPDNVDPFDNARSDLSVIGPLQVMNALLGDSLTYVPAQDMDTFDILTLTVYGEDEEVSDKTDIYVDIEPVNDSPIIKDPILEKSLTLDGSQIILLRGLRVTDDSDTNQKLKVRFVLEPASVGELTQKDYNNGEFVRKSLLRKEGNFDNGHYLVEGTLEDANEAMSKIVIRIDRDYIGEGTLKIEAFDDEEASSKTILSFYVNSISSIPRPIVRNKFMSVFEDEPLRMKDVFVFNETEASRTETVTMKLTTMKVEPSNLFEIHFSSSGCEQTISSKEVFHLWFQDEKSRGLKIGDTSTTIESALMSLPSISAAHVIRDEEDGTHLSVRLLTLSDESEGNKSGTITVSMAGGANRSESCELNPHISSEIDHLGEKVWSTIWRQPKFSPFLFKPVSHGAIAFGEKPVESLETRGIHWHFNNVLNYVQLISPPNFYGKVKINIEIQSSTSSEVFKEQVDIIYEAVDDSPIITFNNSIIFEGAFLELYEDSAVNLNRINVFDVDSAMDPVNVTIRSTVGQLCYPKNITGFLGESSDGMLSSVELGSNIYCKSNGGTLSFTNEITVLNHIIGSLSYQPPPNWWGLDQILVIVNSHDQETFSSFGIFVKAVSDSPVVTVPDVTMTVEESGNLVISGITVADDDIDFTIPESIDQCEISPSSCYITLDLKTSHGVIALIDTNGVTTLTVPGKRIIKGSIDSINFLLKSGIIYEPNESFSGIDHLIVSSTDANGSKSSSQQITIQVKAKYYPTKISLPAISSMLQLKEDTLGVIGSDSCEQGISAPAISCEAIQISGDTQDKNLRFSIFWKYGKFRLPRLRLSQASTVVTNSTNIEVFSREIQIMGKIDMLNWVLASVHVKADQNYHNLGEKSESIVVTVEDQDRVIIAKEQMQIIIYPVNDSPVITFETGIFDPDTVTADGLSLQQIGVTPLISKEDDPIRMKGISVRDVDCDVDEDILELSIKSQFGRLYLPNHILVREWIAGDNRASQEISVRSTPHEINQLLNHLTYRPNKNFFGNDTLEFRLSDFGIPSDYVDGGVTNLSLSDEVQLSLQILPVPDVPVLHGIRYVRMQEDTAEMISFQIDDVDMVSDLHVAIKCTSEGKMKLNSSLGLKLETKSGFVNGTGSASAWNMALQQLTFTPKRNWNNDNRKHDEIKLEVRHMSQGMKMDTSTHVTYVEIQGSPDPHRWQIRDLDIQPNGISDSIYTAEDESVILCVSLADEDAIWPYKSHEEWYSVRISTTSGLLHLNNYNGIFIKSGSPRTSLLQFDATFTSINDALQQLMYTPMSNFNGHDVLTLFCSDKAFYNITAKIPIVILPQVDIPLVKAPVIFECWEGRNCHIHGLSIEDPDLNPSLILDIESREGLMSFAGNDDHSSRAVSLITATSKGDDSYHLQGSGIDLNSVVSNLVYLPRPGTAPTIDIISFTLRVAGPDGGLLENNEESHTKTNILIMKTPRDPPIIRYNEIIYHDNEHGLCASSFHRTDGSDKFCDGFKDVKPINCFENQICSFDKFKVTGDHSITFELYISVQDGTISFNETVTGIHLWRDSMNDDSQVRIRGDTKHVSEALQFLIYTPTDNFVGKDTVDLQLSIPSESAHAYNPILRRLTLDVIVSGFDRIHLFGPTDLQFVNEDEYVTIRDISVHSVSHGGISTPGHFTGVQAVVQTSNGKFHFSQKSSNAVRAIDLSAKSERESVVASHQNDSTRLWTHLMICGDVDDVDKFLRTLSFIGDENWNSADEGDYASLSVGVQRIKNCDFKFDVTQILRDMLQIQNDFEDYISIPIHVNTINDAPDVTMDIRNVGNNKTCLYDQYEICINEDQDVKIKTEIFDIDDDIMLVDVRGQFGKVAVSHGTGNFYDAYFIEGDGNGDYFDNIVFKGTVSAVNEYLRNLHFKGMNNYNGSEGMLCFHVQDQFGGRTSVDVHIFVHPVYDPILLWFVVDAGLEQPILIFNEGETRILGREWIGKADYYMEALSPLETLDLTGTGNERHQIRPLQSSRAFSVSNGDDDLSPDESNVCIKTLVNEGILSIDDIEGINILTDSRHRHGNELVYVGSMQSVNDASETISYVYQSDGGEEIEENLNVNFLVYVTRERCRFIDDMRSRTKCYCDFESPQASGGFKFFVKKE